MGFVKQSELRPITAKEYLIAHWESYGVAETKEEFIGLLNILQACGENLDSLHSVFVNGGSEFCDICHNGCWNSDRELVESLYEFNTFFTEREFTDTILDRREDYDTAEEYVEDIRLEAEDGEGDTQILKTDDGYVKRVWY